MPKNRKSCKYDSHQHGLGHLIAKRNDKLEVLKHKWNLLKKLFFTVLLLKMMMMMMMMMMSIIIIIIIIINNCATKWGLDARNILKFPLLAASSKMETTPMAGKADITAMRPHPPEKTGTRHTDHQWKIEGGKGEREKTTKH